MASFTAQDFSGIYKRGLYSLVARGAEGNAGAHDGGYDKRPVADVRLISKFVKPEC